MSELAGPQKPRRPRARNLFRQRDVSQFIRAIKAAGGGRLRVDNSGCFEVIIGGPDNTGAADDLDRELTEFEGRHARTP